jgi:hypothetical protein
MNIAALCIVSVSELAKVKPEITYDWIDNNREEFLDILHSIGMNVKQPIEKQENVMHRNRFNEITTCDRYVGNERTDKEWINSGYASQEAKDKATGSKMLADLYRLRGAVE